MKNKFQINEVVGIRGYLNHVFGRVVIAKVRNDGKWWYLLDESPHNISEDHESYLVANATNYGKEGSPVEPGLAHSCGWWCETKLKKRKLNTVCKCKFCKKYKINQ